MSSTHTPHIISASSNLLGICFVLITALKVSGISERTLADEICIGASVGFLCSCICSYLSIRSQKDSRLSENIADYIFIASMFSLFFAVLMFARDVI